MDATMVSGCWTEEAVEALASEWPDGNGVGRFQPDLPATERLGQVLPRLLERYSLDSLEGIHGHD